MLPGDPACLCVGPERHVLAAGKAAQRLSNLQVQGRICTQANFCGPKRGPRKSGLTLSRGQVRELAPMITAGHCYRDGDDEASAFNLSPAHDAHPQGRSGTPGGESLCVSHPPSPQRGTGPGQQAGPRGAVPAIPA